MQHMKRTPIIVRVWENDFGIPSVDPECLQLMLVFRLALVDVKFKRANLPFYRAIPSIEHNTHVVTKQKDILAHVQNLCHGAPDCFLVREDVGKVLAYKKYFIHKFVPAFFYDCWINPVNYEHAIKAWYVNAMLYPFGYLYINFKRVQAEERFKNMVGSRNTERIIMKLYHDAQCCLRDLANMLAKDKNQYFLGQYVSTLDTLIYSYLAVALYLPLPEPYLQNLIKERPILVEYVDRMTKQYFPDMKKTFKFVDPIDCTFEPANMKTLLISGFCVTSIMVVYAWNLGLLKNLWMPDMNEINHFYQRTVSAMDKVNYFQLSV